MQYTLHKSKHLKQLFHRFARISFLRFGQIGDFIGGNFNIHIWAWSASPCVQVGIL